MRPYTILMCLSIAAIANAFGAAGEFNPVRHTPMAESEPPVQRIIVKLHAAEMANAAETAGVATLTQRAHLTLKESHRIAGNMHVMQVEPAVSGESVASTLARLRADPAVEYAVVDQRRYAHAIPNDPLYTGQWYLQNDGATPSAVDAMTAWDTTKGSDGIVIADLDTGVRFDHPDLLRAGAGGRLLPGYDFITDIATANDGNGRDADASDPGDNCKGSGSSWHGTRVAGILGAITNNATGVAGLTWNSWLLPVRVLGKCGGFDSDIIEGMLWAAGIHVAGIPDNPYPAQIENMSLGGAGACPQSYRDVISQLTAIGVLVVASAGKEGGPVDTPANCSGVAGVAGLRHIGTKVGYSSLGPEIALSAPAGNCVNTTGACLYSIDTTTNLGTITPSSNSYTDQINDNIGTSFSAPIVAGIAVLMKAVNGNLNSVQLIARLKEGATAFPVSSDGTIPTCQVPTSTSPLQDECNCTTQTCGAGMANAANAVTAALRPIAAVSVPGGVAPGQNVVLQGGGSAAACLHSLSSYSWSIVNGGPTPPGISGANTATATVTAPSSGSYTVRLTVTDDASRQDTADVVVSPTAATTTVPATAGTNACLPVTVSVVVSPASASVNAGSDTTAFSATVLNTSNTALTWKVNNVTGGNADVGTISATGVYTAPASVPSPATVTVTAVSVADTSQSGSAQVTITPPATISSGGGGSSGGSGGGGGALDLLTLFAGTPLVAARMKRRGKAITLTC